MLCSVLIIMYCKTKTSNVRSRIKPLILRNCRNFSGPGISGSTMYLYVETGSAKTAGFLNDYFCVGNIGKYFQLKIPFIKSVKELKRRGFRVHLPETFLYGIPFVFFC